jgi:hypothetical protein
MKALHYVFILSLLLIAAVYYIGLTSDVNAVGPQVRGILNAVTGRNSNGAFAAYPTGG